MRRLSNKVILTCFILLSLRTKTVSSVVSPCVEGTFNVEIDGDCTYENVFSSFASTVFPLVSSTCPHSAQVDFDLILGGGNAVVARAAVVSGCHSAYDNAYKFPFADINRKYDEFEKIYYAGGTLFNEEYETLYGDKGLGERSNRLRTGDKNDGRNYDAARIRRFFDYIGQRVHVEWPDYLENFKCEHNAAMCCWPQDRQANDNNGNCNKPYDINCIDKDPADNTDLCYVDVQRGAAVTDFDSPGGGWLLYPFDNSDGEGSIHCHGFAWADDEYDYTARYKANNLFFVSMYDHLHQRGYVREVPGAPMCACTDQMPIASRADCTQIAVDESYNLVWNGNNFDGEITYIEIDFQSCQGYNNQNNDLWAYMQRLYFYDRKVPSGKLAELAKTLVEDRNCPYAAEAFLSDRLGVIPGYIHDSTTTIQLAGRNAIDSKLYGKMGFKALTDGRGLPFVLCRKCISCPPPFDTICYRRLTQVPIEFDLLSHLKNSRAESNYTLINEDFTLHSSLEEAEAGDNPWTCTNDAGEVSPKYTDGFPYDCAPDGKRTSQESRFEPRSGKSSVGWYIERDAANDLTEEVSVDVGNVNIRGLTASRDGTYYITGSGRDIWSRDDEFHYYHDAPRSWTDGTFYARVTSLDYRHEWTKACIMIRDSLNANSKHFSVCLTGWNAVETMYRTNTGGSSGAGNGRIDDSFINTANMKLVKQGNTYTAYKTEDMGEVTDATVWTQVSSSRTITFDNANGDGSYYVGFALTSHSDGYLAEAVVEGLDYVEGAVLTDPVRLRA